MRNAGSHLAKRGHLAGLKQAGIDIVLLAVLFLDGFDELARGKDSACRHKHKTHDDKAQNKDFQRPKRSQGLPHVIEHNQNPGHIFQRSEGGQQPAASFLLCVCRLQRTQRDGIALPGAQNFPEVHLRHGFSIIDGIGLQNAIPGHEKGVGAAARINTLQK